MNQEDLEYYKTGLTILAKHGITAACLWGIADCVIRLVLFRTKR